MKTLVEEIRDSLNLLETADIIRWGEQYSANTSPFVERVRKAIRWGVADLQLQRPLAVNLSSANAAAHSKQNHSISVPIFPENYKKIGTSPEFTIFHELVHAKRFEDGDDVTTPKLDEAITQAVADAWNKFYPDRFVDAAELYLRIMTWKRTDQFLRFFTLQRGHKYFAMQPGENLPDDAEAIIGRGPLVDQEWSGKEIADAYNSLLPWEVDANNTAREMEGRYKAENPVSEMRRVMNLLENAGWNEDELHPMPDNIQAKFRQEFPGGESEVANLLTWGHGEIRMLPSISWLEFKSSGKGEKITDIQRAWWFDRNVFELENLVLNVKNEKIGKDIAYGAYEFARRMGIAKLELHAVNEGAYFWARAGFLPRSEDWDDRRRAIIGSIEGKLYGEEAENNMRTAAAKLTDDPRSIWDAADTNPGGYDLLCSLGDSGWHGYLDMADGRQTQRLVNYIRS